jgi:hydrogenase-4 component B
MYPLHVWLPIAHPAAPAPASALLSGIITKTGIFGVIVISANIFLHDGYWGFVILMFGVVTMLCGGILAVFSVDLKRTLACSSMSQLGFIFVGIGMQGLLGEENALAVRGTMLHMFNHSNLKLVLFMAAGVVVMNLHKLNLNDVRGFGRKKPLLMYTFLMGSLGIGGIPLFNGYISKTLIHESIVEYIELLEEGHAGATFALASGESAVILFKVIEWLFIITGAMTVAYMTKLFIALFVEKNNDPSVQAAFDEKRHYCSKVTGAVLAVSATVLPILGLFPYRTLDKLADMGQGFMYGESPAHAVNYFSWTNVKGGLYSIIIGALIYIVIIRGWMMAKTKQGVTVYANRWPAHLDLLELVYVPVVMVILPAVAAFFSRCLDFLLDALILLARKTTHRQLHGGKVPPNGYRIAFILGTVFNTVALWLNKTFFRKHPLKRDFIIRFAARERIIKQANRIIVASVSFSLLMFCIGIMIVVLYLFLS